MKLALILMALVAITALAQNRWDKMTAEDKQSSALNYIVGTIFIIAVAIIAAVMI
jgi:ABC-type phosphate transport system permease subunit